MIASTTPGTHNPRISAQTVTNRFREIGEIHPYSMTVLYAAFLFWPSICIYCFVHVCTCTFILRFFKIYMVLCPKEISMVISFVMVCFNGLHLANHQHGLGWFNSFIWVASMDCIWQTAGGFGWSNSFIWAASMDCIWQTHQRGFGWSNSFIWVASMDCIWQTHQRGFGWSNLFIWVASMDCIWQTHQRGFGWSNSFIWVASMESIWQTHQCGFGWSNSFYMGCFNGLHLANPPAWVWMVQFSPGITPQREIIQT